MSPPTTHVSCRVQKFERKSDDLRVTTDTFWTYNLKIQSDDLDDRFVDFIPIRSRYMTANYILIDPLSKYLAQPPCLVVERGTNKTKLNLAVCTCAVSLYQVGIVRQRSVRHLSDQM